MSARKNRPGPGLPAKIAQFEPAPDMAVRAVKKIKDNYEAAKAKFLEAAAENPAYAIKWYGNEVILHQEMVNELTRHITGWDEVPTVEAAHKAVSELTQTLTSSAYFMPNSTCPMANIQTLMAWKAKQDLIPVFLKIIWYLTGEEV